MILNNNQIRVKLFESLKNSFFKKSVILAFILLFVLLVTGFSVIMVRFHYKLELNQQKDFILENEKLDEQWSQIVLEYSSLASPQAVENFARKEKMFLPGKDNIVILNKQNKDNYSG